MDTTRQVISEKYPEYLAYFDECFSGCYNYLANMIIAPKEVFDAYSEWLFDILFEVERKTDLTNYTVQEARIYGYISERLLRVWVEKNKLKVKSCRIVNTEEQHNIKFYLIEVLKYLKLYQLAKKILFGLKGRKK